MKNLLYFSAAIALSLLAAPRAHADTYTINFQPNPDSGLVGPIGSFSYDASAAVGQQFSNFTVTLTGDNVDVLNFTASANSGLQARAERSRDVLSQRRSSTSRRMEVVTPSRSTTRRPTAIAVRGITRRIPTDFSRLALRT
jgi:hypothetical protein